MPSTSARRRDRILIVLGGVDGASPARPLRWLSAPGPELLRENVPALEVSIDPSDAELERIARIGEARVFFLFDGATLPRAIEAAARLGDRVERVAVRGRLVPGEALAAFDELWLGSALLPRLAADGLVVGSPSRWPPPRVLAEAWRREGSVERLGTVFSRSPEPGLLDFADVGRDGRREGAVAITLAGSAGPTATEIDATVADFRRLGITRVLLVDLGGPVGAVAARLAARGALGGFFARADRRIPTAVGRAGVPVFLWFEPEDAGRVVRGLAGTRASVHAYVPIGLPGESPRDAEDRVRRLRDSGASVVVPRFPVPLPVSREWLGFAAVARLRDGERVAVDGSVPLFLPAGWEVDGAAELVARIRAEDAWCAASPEPTTSAGPYSLGAVRRVVDGYVREVRLGPVSLGHARDLFAEVVGDLRATELEALADYPFLAWRGQSLLARIDGALERRLRRVEGAPEPLIRALRHTALSGGKRIRPVLALAIALAHDAPAAAALRAAVALEWLHTASLVQDDLPLMDDDSLRRGRASAHVRHGDGLALLASDALVSLAFEDLASLADDPAVGAERAARLVASFARALGPAGVVGGQALDLLARERGPVRDAREHLAIQRRKTAPFFRLAATIGARLGGVAEERRLALEEALEELGLAFQMTDDLLDGDADSRRRSLARARTRAFATTDAREPFRTAFGRLADFVVSRSA